MNLEEFKNQNIRNKYEINDHFGKIITLIDFGNVNYWYEKDERDEEGELLKKNDKLIVDIEKMADFCSSFSRQIKFYYGLDQKQKKSFYLIKKARKCLGKTNAVTKNIQYIKHYLDSSEKDGNTRSLNYNKKGSYVYIPKCNFDVEICIDTIRLLDKYDTLCLFSGDSDFVSLLRFIKQKNKKVILIKGGPTVRELKSEADLILSSQSIKKELAIKKSDLLKKQKSRP